jgi:hypothetical protein
MKVVLTPLVVKTEHYSYTIRRAPRQPEKI